MNNSVIISLTALLTTLAACSSNNNKEMGTATTEVQQASIDSNAAAAPTTVNTAELPTFNLQDKNGDILNLQRFKGKKVFVNLWASWCPPCRAEMPSIQRLAKSVDTGKVAFVMLSLDEHFDKAKGFIKAKKLTLPIYYPAENLPALFNVQAIPSTFIFNESGRLIQRIDGGDNYDTKEYTELLK